MSRKYRPVQEQAASLLNAYFRPGEKRHDAKCKAREAGRSPMSMLLYMYSHSTLRRMRDSIVTFVAWCEDNYGIHYLNQIRRSYVRKYIEYRIAKVKTNTVATDLVALRRLDMCMLNKGWIRRSIVPKDLCVPRPDVPRGGYPYGQALAIIDLVAVWNPLAAMVLRFQLSAGLRLREAITLRSEFIILNPACVTIVGKGGRVRTSKLLDTWILTNVDTSKRMPLRPIKQGFTCTLKESSWKSSVQQLVRKACKELGIQCRGSHAMRCTAAVRFFEQRVNAGCSRLNAMRDTSEWLGHGRKRVDVMRKYLGKDLVDSIIRETTPRRCSKKQPSA